MMRRNILLPVLLLSIVFVTGFVSGDADIYFKISKSIDIFGRIYKEVAINYVDKINPEELMLSGIRGMLQALDPYTVYIDEKQQSDIDLITTGKYGGIGATVGLRNDNIIVVDLIEGYSAQRQGVRIGDEIVKVNGVLVSKENYDELGSLLKGEPGTVVSIVIKRDGRDENLIYNLVREEIEVNNLSYYGFVPKDSKNAYLKLSGFTRTAGEEVKKALFELKNQKEIESIILDLRGNPGGLLDAAIDVSEKFLKKGQLVVAVMGRDSSSQKQYYSGEEPIANTSRLVVLVDIGSASASEIVAGALQDHDRAVIVGTHSFGKGLVQTVIPLSYNTSLKMTTARYFTPSGRCIQKINYSEKNKVFDEINSFENKAYKTDLNRIVFAAGGIKPDTIISAASESHFVEQLLAQGMFFMYTTHICNDSTLIPDNIQVDLMYNRFLNYLESQKFEFSFKEEKLLQQLNTLTAKNGYSTKFKNELTDLTKEFNLIKSRELDKYKDEILTEIKLEIKARREGRVGRIIESLKFDKQYQSAYEIVKDKNIYNRFLNISE